MKVISIPFHVWFRYSVLGYLSSCHNGVLLVTGILISMHIVEMRYFLNEENLFSMIICVCSLLCLIVIMLLVPVLVSFGWSYFSCDT